MHACRRLTGSAAVSALVVPMLVACGGSSSGGANASCVGPYLDDQQPGGRYGAPAPTVTTGETLTVYGHGYTSTCNDTGGDDPQEPLAPVHLTLTLPGARVVPLGEFTPHGRDMGFKADVHIPRGTRGGTAMIRDDQTNPVTYRFKVATE
jgi:hypothetical protein